MYVSLIPHSSLLPDEGFGIELHEKGLMVGKEIPTYPSGTGAGRTMGINCSEACSMCKCIIQ